MAQVGRPSLFTQERAKAILQTISNYIPYEVAAASHGIGKRTLYYWLEKGGKDLDDEVDSDFAKFFQEVKKIEIKLIKSCIEKVIAGEQGWQGSAWLLERKFYKYFSSDSATREMLARIEKLEKTINQKEEKDGKTKCSKTQKATEK